MMEKNFEPARIISLPEKKNHPEEEPYRIDREGFFPWQEELKKKIKPEELPIGKEREKLIKMLEKAITEGNRIALIQGETGSGKSVLLPEMMREVLKRNNLPNKILSVQPRRDAALNVSRVISAVEGVSWGKRGNVGCSTSEANEINRNSETIIATTGVALRYISDLVRKSGSKTKEEQEDDFGAIIVDEFHENSVEYHLIMGMLKILQEKGKAPFVLLTSATLDKERTQEFFNIRNDYYANIEGRTYPVKESYWEKDPESQDDEDNYIENTVSLTKKALEENPTGDILVFLPGVKEISSAIEKLGDIPNTEIIPLHGSLQIEERDYAINGTAPIGKRRVIVSTNIAETSLTLPKITAVVDSCRKRTFQYNPETGIYERMTIPISKDSAKQRGGRAGRVQEGKCYRAVTKETWEKMDEFTTPEINYANLSNVVLKIRGLEIDPMDFPFIETPERIKLEAAEKQLELLGAIEDGKLTDIGKRMLAMPFFEPNTARMMVEGERRNLLEETLIMAILQRESHVFLSPSLKTVFNRQVQIAKASYGWEYKGENPPIFYYEGERVDQKTSRDYLQRSKKNIQDSLRNEYDELHSRFGTSSDWQRNLNAFSEATKIGLFEALQGEATPEGRRAKRELGDWCRENHLNEKAFLHSARHMYDYSRAIGVRFNQEKIADISLSRGNEYWEEISKIILSGHPHTLLIKDPRERIPSYRFFAENTGQTAHISPESAGFRNPHEFLISTRISEGRRDKYDEEIRRFWAHNTHPISFEQILEVLPNLLEKRRGEIEIEDHSGELFRTLTFSPKSYPEHRIGIRRETPTEEEKIQFLSKKFAKGDTLGMIWKIRENELGFQRSNIMINRGKLEEIYSEILRGMPSPLSLPTIEMRQQELSISQDQLEGPKPTKNELPEISVGNGNDDSPFARAMRKAMEKKKGR